ncbi:MULTISPECIES: hypothetical protein [Bacillus]|uniref:Uncharacterized protein n=3 Tax=Bacillus thuringiensis TaxID=1428 RepID=A0AAP4Q6X1_BACTU|nr:MULTISPECIES: hypothetical protein [Bacillus]MEC0046193.1 hypothetical protein [Bacillus cereus]AFV21553.1 hypothetical protein BTB_502p02480 [Bacillus thuringiensis Bt407]ERI01271.1 hypothetical protein BTCBT_002826 [Bacillus thuringiensis T01-328]MBN6708009.1 hypothetical protein [Bacillus thuringiensis]MDN7078835.1 hypothetical protein [Bacillus thuringiensis]
MELHYWEKQLILYTKGHFKRIDYKKDIKLFTAKLYGLGLEDVGMQNILHMVLDIYEALCENGYINFKLKTFIATLLKKSAFKSESNKIDAYDILQELLAEIQGISVLRNGLDLGKADRELLEEIMTDKTL